MNNKKKMESNLTTWNREDRDLLVELRTEMKGVRSDIKQLTDGNNIRLDDHENRIRDLESIASEYKTKVRTLVLVGGGLFAVFQIAVQIALNTLKH